MVQAKAPEARKWVGYANERTAETGGKTWTYALFLHDEVLPGATLGGMMACYEFLVPELAAVKVKRTRPDRALKAIVAITDPRPRNPLCL